MFFNIFARFPNWMQRRCVMRAIRKRNYRYAYDLADYSNMDICDDLLRKVLEAAREDNN